MERQELLRDLASADVEVSYSAAEKLLELEERERPGPPMPKPMPNRPLGASKGVVYSLVPSMAYKPFEALCQTLFDRIGRCSTASASKTRSLPNNST